jgi:hypothetical protein
MMEKLSEKSVMASEILHGIGEIGDGLGEGVF